MDRLTKKLKKGGYSANRNSDEALQERLDQFLGVHQYWLEQVQEMEQGIGQASEMGQEADLSLMMLKTAYNAVVRIGRRFASILAGRASILGGLILIGIGLEIFIRGL